MEIFVVTCTFNDSETLIDCAFKTLKDAKAYAKVMNGDPTKAVAHCKEVIALRLGEAMVKFLNEESGVEFEVVDVDVK